MESELIGQIFEDPQTTTERPLLEEEEEESKAAEGIEQASTSQLFRQAFSEKLVSFVDGIREQSAFSSSAGSTDAARLNKEVKALTRGLPCDEYSAIFMAVDSADMSKMSALVAGASSTPYAHGLFEFHIDLPSHFPQEPPKMTHITSSMTRIGFSPNLYADGYVCLSIIGTWGGDETESWMPSKNLLQVLVSIQALVMEDNIIAKEPGLCDYEVDSVDNIIYQNIVKVATVRHAMTEQLRKPPFGFAEQVNAYFRIKKTMILDTINDWLIDAAQQTVKYTHTDTAQGYNPTLYEELQTQGYYEVLFAAATDFRQVLAEVYGDCDLPELFVKPLFKEPSPDDPQAPDSTHEYFQLLQGYRINMDTLSEDSETQLSEAVATRLNKEMAAMSRALPCEPEASIFVTFDNANLSYMQALISGPEDSPYAHGLFLFEFGIPSTYPSSPPTVKILTTGGGSVRFNPNLYADGLVCLSVINTWEGSAEESWNPSFSTLTQVLMSIQSLVMDPQVIHKEPAYYNSPLDHKGNTQYSVIVKYATLKYAITNMILTPPAGFQDLVRTYFRLKKAAILAKAEEWVQSVQDYSFEDIDRLVVSHNGHLLSELQEGSVAAKFGEALDSLKQAFQILE